MPESDSGSGLAGPGPVAEGGEYTGQFERGGSAREPGLRRLQNKFTNDEIFTRQINRIENVVASKK